MKDFLYAPVILFVYNRPTHTIKTIEALCNNIESSNTDLFVFSDGARTKKDEKKVADVRRAIHDINGFRSVTIEENSVNKGLASNIICGVSKVIERYGMAIIVEDDVVVSTNFLRFMNDALLCYENERKVWAISGYCWVGDKEKASFPSTFFLPWFSCWGWATWKDRWIQYTRAPEDALRTTSMDDRRILNFNGKYNMWEQVEKNVSGQIATWAIFFSLLIVRNKGVVLYSNKDVCRNIGNDDSGTNSGKSSVFDRNELSDDSIIVEKKIVFIDKRAEKVVENFFKRLSGNSIKNKVKVFVAKILKMFGLKLRG